MILVLKFKVFSVVLVSIVVGWVGNVVFLLLVVKILEEVVVEVLLVEFFGVGVVVIG